jgi:HAD superfamily hydrolase (TIGR01490 family)
MFSGEGDGGAAPTGVAFFDVDETLLSVRTLESFLLYYRALHPGFLSDERLAELTTQVVHADRASFNRLYYSLWAGQSVSRVLEAGEDWYRIESAEAGFFRPNVAERLEEHRRSGAAVVLVSGSFAAPLNPLVRQIAADAVFSTNLEEENGRYTGRVIASMIGEDKKAAVVAYLAGFSQHLESWAYGDHVSDLPFLQAASNPVVVGADPELVTIATQREWPIIAIDVPLRPRG